MATDSITVKDEASGLEVATRTISENSLTKHVTRVQPENPGRQELTLHAVNVVGVTTEALFSMTPVTDFVNGTAGTSYTVPTGKKLVITSITATSKVNGATESATTFNLRVNPSGAAAATSPIAWTGTTGCPDPASVANNGLPPICATFPDGIEIPAGAGVGVSRVATGSTHNTDSVSVNGYLKDA
jgi:hypothetical protein